MVSGSSSKESLQKCCTGAPSSCLGDWGCRDRDNGPLDYPASFQAQDFCFCLFFFGHKMCLKKEYLYLNNQKKHSFKPNTYQYVLSWLEHQILRDLNTNALNWSYLAGIKGQYNLIFLFVI